VSESLWGLVQECSDDSCYKLVLCMYAVPKTCGFFLTDTVAGSRGACYVCSTKFDVRSSAKTQINQSQLLGGHLPSAAVNVILGWQVVLVGSLLDEVMIFVTGLAG